MEKYDKDIKYVPENDEDDGKENKNGYEYLLRSQFRSVTREKIEKLQKDIDSFTRELKKLLNTTEKEMWLEDLDDFLVKYNKWLKTMEKEAEKLQKSKKRKRKR